MGEGKGSQEKGGAGAEEEAAMVMIELGGGEESTMGAGAVGDDMRAGVGEDVQVTRANVGCGF